MQTTDKAKSRTGRNSSRAQQRRKPSAPARMFPATRARRYKKALEDLRAYLNSANFTITGAHMMVDKALR